MLYDRENFLISRKKISMHNLKTLRKKKKYSQIKLSYLTGVSSSSIEAYEQGVRVPSLPIIYKIAEVLDCSIDYLIGRNTDIENYYTLSESDKKKVIKYIKNIKKSSKDTK